MWEVKIMVGPLVKPSLESPCHDRAILYTANPILSIGPEKIKSLRKEHLIRPGGTFTLTDYTTFPRC